MVSLNNKINYIQVAAGLLPIGLSAIFLMKKSGFVLLLCIVSLFIIIGTIPLFRKRESLWMFIFVALAGLPINIRLSFWLVSEGVISSGFMIGDIVWGALLCCVFFSAEEIAFGVITRLIWRRQYKINI